MTRMKQVAFSLSMACMLGAVNLGCRAPGIPEPVDLTASDAPDSAGQSQPAQRRISDGTSNTIALGESGAPAPAGSGSRGAPATAVGDGSVREDSPPAEDNSAQISALTAQLGDKLLSFGHSSFFSSGSITESDDLELCAAGRFGMRITRITTTEFGDLSSEETLAGTWSVVVENGSAIILLRVEQASDANDTGERRIALSLNANGTLLLDGEPAQIADAAADCASVGQQP